MSNNSFSTGSKEGKSGGVHSESSVGQNTNSSDTCNKNNYQEILDSSPPASPPALGLPLQPALAIPAVSKPEDIVVPTRPITGPPAVVGEEDGYVIYEALQPWGKHNFHYDKLGQLAEDVTFTRESLYEYIYHHPLGKKLTMWVQRHPMRPATELHYLKTGYGSTCRAKYCEVPPRKPPRMIEVGNYRIAFDELTARLPNNKADTHVHAAFLHVSCMEKMIDMCEVARHCTFEMENREYVNNRLACEASAPAANRMVLETRHVPGACLKWIGKVRDTPGWQPQRQSETLNYALYTAKWGLRPHRKKDPNVPGMFNVDIDPQLVAARPVNGSGTWGGLRIKGVRVNQMAQVLSNQQVTNSLPFPISKKAIKNYNTKLNGPGNGHSITENCSVDSSSSEHVQKKRKRKTPPRRKNRISYPSPEVFQNMNTNRFPSIAPNPTVPNQSPTFRCDTTPYVASPNASGSMMATDGARYYLTPDGKWEKVDEHPLADAYPPPVSVSIANAYQNDAYEFPERATKRIRSAEGPRTMSYANMIPTPTSSYPQNNPANHYLQPQGNAFWEPNFISNQLSPINEHTYNMANVTGTEIFNRPTNDVQASPNHGAVNAYPLMYNTLSSPMSGTLQSTNSWYPNGTAFDANPFGHNNLDAHDFSNPYQPVYNAPAASMHTVPDNIPTWYPSNTAFDASPPVLPSSSGPIDPMITNEGEQNPSPNADVTSYIDEAILSSAPNEVSKQFVMSSDTNPSFEAYEDFFKGLEDFDFTYELNRE